MRSNRSIFAGLAALVLTLVACSQPEDTAPMESAENNAPVAAVAVEDPYLWLESVEGARSLAWAAEQNAKSLLRLQGDPRFEEIRNQVGEILTSDDRIPFANLVNGMVYNFWQDDEHVRGILRRTTLENYTLEEIQWETVLDVDALANLENANWVYKGRRCLSSDPGRCLLSLSDGGKDAVVIREYDLDNQVFVDGGFELDEAKTRLAWVDANTLLVGTDFGAGSLTTSGYPRTIRLWRRGIAINEAEQLFEIGAEDVSAGAFTVSLADRDYSFVDRSPDFFTEETLLLTDEGLLAKLPLPIDANFQGVLGQSAIVLLRSDWSSGVGETFSAGSLIAMNLVDSARTGVATDVATILAPTSSAEVDAISGVAITSESIYISALKDVAGVILRARIGNDGWELSRVSLPENGAIQVVSADDHTDTVMLTYESFLVPDTLYLIEGDADPRVIKALKPRFDASDLVTEQKFARSADGTRIPYFIVRSATTPMDGSTPTELTAYGGFEVSRTPTYMPALDQVWLTRGGAFVLANIRGGGEYGPEWHQSALLENRQRVFDDFIAVAEDLIASGLTSSEHLGIRGGSNGGLLVTAVMVQRPELFKGIISAVPLIDMLRYHKLLAGASWMAEYGNPDIPEHHAFISEYSPYQLVSADVDYPEIFLWTNPKEDRVHPGHARKMAARMIEQGHDIIYFENAEGGHGGGANLMQQAQTTAMQLVYLLQQLAD